MISTNPIEQQEGLTIIHSEPGAPSVAKMPNPVVLYQFPSSPVFDNFKVKVIDEDTVDRIDTGANHHPSSSYHHSTEEEFPPIFRDQVHKSPVGQSNTGKIYYYLGRGKICCCIATLTFNSNYNIFWHD